MNKLIAISVLLLSLNLHGADKVLPSQYGLEGYGESGLRVGFSTIDNPKPALMKAHAENMLTKAGFKINEAQSSDWIWIGVIPIKVNGKVVLRTVHMHLYRDLEFTTKSGKRYRSNSISRAYGGTPQPQSETELVSVGINAFIRDWRKANPKK